MLLISKLWFKTPIADYIKFKVKISDFKTLIEMFALQTGGNITHVAPVSCLLIKWNHNNTWLIVLFELLTIEHFPMWNPTCIHGGSSLLGHIPISFSSHSQNALKCRIVRGTQISSIWKEVIGMFMHGTNSITIYSRK